MKIAKTLAAIAACVCIGAALPAVASAQAMENQYVADFGAAFTQATVERAQFGMAGLDIQVGKMLTNSLAVGVATGFDICSFRIVEYPDGETVYERLGVIPLLLKARFCANIAPLMQVHAALGGGIYQAVPHLDTQPIGRIQDSGTHVGGSGAVGFTYYFLGRQGIGAEFEYHFFDSGEDMLFSYFAARINYSIIMM